MTEKDKKPIDGKVEEKPKDNKEDVNTQTQGVSNDLTGDPPPPPEEREDD